MEDLRSRQVADAAARRRRIDAGEILQRDRRRNPAPGLRRVANRPWTLWTIVPRVVVDRTREKLLDLGHRSAVGEQFQDNRLEAPEDADRAAIGAPFDACASVPDHELETRRRGHCAACVQNASGACSLPVLWSADT